MSVSEPRSFKPVGEAVKRRRRPATSVAALASEVVNLEEKVDDIKRQVERLCDTQDLILGRIKLWGGMLIGAGVGSGLFGQEVGKWLLNLIG